MAFAAGITAFVLLAGNWWLFALLFLLPDLGMLGYLRGPKAGAFSYNLTHTHAGPALLAAVAWAAAPALLPVAAVWFAHIGFDRALGYGLRGRTSQDQHRGPYDLETEGPSGVTASATVALQAVSRPDRGGPTGARGDDRARGRGAGADCDPHGSGMPSRFRIDRADGPVPSGGDIDAAFDEGLATRLDGTAARPGT